MRLKDRRRLTLAAVAIVVLAAGLFSAFVVRGWQVKRQTGEYLAQALSAFKAGDYYSALGDSAQFIRRVPKDDPRLADALLTYAESRRNVAEADGHNLRDAKSFYEQYLARRPDDLAVQQTLLELYNQCGYSVEARDLAVKMLGIDIARASAGPDGETTAAIQRALAGVQAAQVPVLRAGAEALLANKELGNPLLDAMLQRLLQLAPLDLHANVHRINFLVQSDRKAEARALGAALIQAHPEDPRACMVAAVSLQVNATPADHAEAMKLLSRAAGVDPGTAERLATPSYADAELAGHLVSILDGYGAFDHSLAVLEDGAERLGDPVVRAQLFRRLWQEDNNAAIEQRAAGLDPASPAVRADTLGFRALSLMRVGRFADGLKIAAVLEGRSGDYLASAWSKVIPLYDASKPPKPSAAVAVLQAAVKATNRREPVFLELLGEAQASLGLNEDARKSWAEAAASPSASSWPTPWIRTAETFLAEGRPEDAAAAATSAMRISPGRVLVNIVWFEAQAARLQRGSTGDPGPAAVLEKLNIVERSLLSMPRSTATEAMLDRLLPSKVVLLVHSGRKEEAIAAASAAMGSSPPPRVETLQRLAAISIKEQLGFEARCLDLAEQSSGATLPVEFTRAMELAAKGQAKEGLARLVRAAAANPGDPAGAIAVARFKERSGDSTALAAWTELGSRFPDNLAAQQAILGSAAAAADRTFVEATIDRYAAILGGSGAGADDALAQTARARALLYGSPTKADRDRAVGILAAVVSRNPSNIEAKLILASALSLSDPAKGVTPDLPRATSQLLDASTLDPRSVSIAIDLARLYQAQREFARAREILNRVATDTGVAADFRSAAAELLIAQGETAPVAIKTLEEVASAKGQGTPSGLLVLLAECYLSQRQDGPAAATYARLAEGAADSPDSIYMTARHFALLGDDAKSAQVLSRLDSLPLDPGAKDFVLARLLADQGRADAAARFEAAVAAAPSRAELWREFAFFQIRRGELSEAARVADRAVAALPNDGSLAALRTQVRTLAAGDPDPDVAELLRAILVGSPRTAERVAEFSQAIRESKLRGEFATADGLSRLADRFAGEGPFELFIARRMAALDQERAAAIAGRALSGNPGDPGVAKGAAEVFMALGRYSDLLGAATAWRQRDISRGVEPDIAVAEAQLRLGRFDDGLRTLSPRLGDAVKAVSAKSGDVLAPRVINIYTRLLVGKGDLDAARRLIEPLLPVSRDLRIFALDIAASEMPSTEDAIKWIELVRSTISPTSIDERLIASTSYAVLEQRMPRDSAKLLGLSITMLKEMSESPDTALPVVFEMLGKLYHRSGEFVAAESAYRRAIALDARRIDSINNLANILLETRGDAEGALALAKQAVQIDPKPSTMDTLASVHAYRGSTRSAAGDELGATSDFRQAAELYRRVAGLSVPLDRALPLRFAAGAYERAGDTAAALAIYEDLLSIPNQKSIEVAVAKNNAAMCLLRLNRGTADLERAADLISDAIRESKDPAFYDTKGWVELESRRPDSAAAAFRTAIQLRAAPQVPLASSVIGLATALAGGTPGERQEAAALLASLPAEAALSKPDRERLKQLRAVLEPGGG